MTNMEEEFRKEFQRMSNNIAQLNRRLERRLERREERKERRSEIFWAALMFIGTSGAVVAFILMWFYIIADIIKGAN